MIDAGQIGVDSQQEMLFCSHGNLVAVSVVLYPRLQGFVTSRTPKLHDCRLARLREILEERLQASYSIACNKCIVICLTVVRLGWVDTADHQGIFLVNALPAVDVSGSNHELIELVIFVDLVQRSHNGG